MQYFVLLLLLRNKAESVAGPKYFLGRKVAAFKRMQSNE